MSQERPCAADEPDYVRNAKPDPHHDRMLQAYDCVNDTLSCLYEAMGYLDEAILLEIIPDDLLSLAVGLRAIEYDLKRILGEG